MKGAKAIAGAIVALGLLVLARSARASVADPFAPDLPIGDLPSPDDQAAPDPVAALLFSIGVCETSLAAMLDGSAYTTFYGGAHFSDLSNHPVLTGEMRGVPLSDSMCAAAGYGPGCVSTAAGAYQFNVPTWREADALGDPLPDFSPESQDEAARRILQKIGALSLLENGDVSGAIVRASQRWASLPGSTAKQRPKSLDFALNAYQTGLSVQA